MKKLSAKEVSDCHNAPMSVRGDVTNYFVCGTCHKPCDPSETNEYPRVRVIDNYTGKVGEWKPLKVVETNESPVESVSQPKAADGYLKKFDYDQENEDLRSKLDHVRDTTKMMDEAYLSVTNDLPNRGDE